jgi:hypothetical protein
MKLDEKILLRFNELIDMGQRVLNTKYDLGSFVGDSCVDSELTSQWVTSVQNFINQVFGKDSIYLENINNKITGIYITYSPVVLIQGVLKAAKDDYENNHIYNLKTLIEAEVFDDFLEQAEYLLSVGYYQPSTVIVGAVLEDSLRKLCIKNNIVLEDKPKMDKMNADLAKRGFYNKLVQKQITTFADLRNKAAHGKWDEFSIDDVKAFISWIRNFMSNYF